MADDALAYAHFSSRPHQRLPLRRVGGNRPQKKNLDLPALIFARAKQPARKNFGIVQHQPVAGLQELRKIAEVAIFPSPFATMNHQHPGSGPVRQRCLRNQLFRERVIEWGNVHPSDYCSGNNVPCDSSSSQFSG